MPWCPNCKNEYIDGITKCADCGCDLVEALTEENELSEGQGEPGVPLSFLRETEEEGAPVRGVYKGSDEKASEFKDSGYTLIGVGGVGLILVLLLAFGVFPLQIPFSMPYLMYGVMGTMFLIFIIVGIRSMQSAKVYKKQALSESNLKDEIMSWCRGELTSEQVSACVEDKIRSDGEQPELMNQLTEEEIYFQRTAVIRELVSSKFMNIDDAFMDNLIDEFYSEIFGE